MSRDPQINDSILKLATEDFYPVWQVLWRLRTLLPNKTDEDLRQLAIANVEALLDDGFIALYSRHGSAQELTPLQFSAETRLALYSCNIWNPKNDVQILVSATKEGSDFYYL
jgi:hypothetical protein